MEIALKEVGRALGLTEGPDGVAKGWSIDSRTIAPGDLFFALRGPAHDGHDYIAEVFGKGAIAVVAERAVDAGGPVLVVQDSLEALQRVAAWARQMWAGDVIGVTGSAGKTTTKDVIAEMLSTQMKTGKTVGNFNNHVGVPMSLLRLEESARVAVIEMGMNHAGEIRDLAEIAKPDHGVVTNVGYAHIESFQSIEGIAAAKRELIDALPPDGTAVLNADDARVKAMGRGRKALLYGMSADADVRAEDVEFLSGGAKFRVGASRFETALSGRHSVLNILAGLAVARIYGIAPERLVDAVRNLKPGKMRGEMLMHRGILVLNDCYNSNPDAAKAMLDVLRDTPARRRIAVLGEMLELGRWAEPLHRDVGSYAAEQGIDVLVGIRGAAWSMVDAARLAGHSAGAALFFDDPADAGRAVREMAQAGDAVLFKGSRGVHVEHALEQFLAPMEGSTG
ncbi:MAG TPA: UDP-N-acetylmuramoyl-tripeptide--D-alanyl-D-alanine ligase [Bryobacteraceae bacterium]|nr:UDP-N-acetylmuramoyl-tripeptide--D-alanyl-D-alanine ligase [Bryobacteraceae bacterium]